MTFKLKEIALKAAWVIKYSKNENSFYVQAITKILPGPIPYIWNAFIKVKDIVKLQKKMCDAPLLWYDNWKCWMCFNERNKEDIKLIDQTLWFNSSIRVDDKTYIDWQLYKKGLLYVKDLVDNDTGLVCTSEQLELKYGKCNNFLAYPSLREAVIKQVLTK